MARTRVVIDRAADTNPIASLDRVLDEAAFFDRLYSVWSATNLAKSQFRVTIKASFMMAIHRDLVAGAATDPVLVGHLAERLASLGFTDISVVETENAFSRWYIRDVASVAQYVGYVTGTSSSYRIVDLSSPEEAIAFDYGLGLHHGMAGRTWKDAHFRISFGKNKTNPFCVATASLKNIFGCLPPADKLTVYHGSGSEFDTAVVASLVAHPVHFALVDAITSGTGLWGLVGRRQVRTGAIFGGVDPIAVDVVAMRLMGNRDATRSRIVRRAIARFGEPVFTVEGDDRPYEDWQNVPSFSPWLLDILEESGPVAHGILRLVSLNMDTIAFPSRGLL